MSNRYMWGTLLKPRDSSNRESRTLFFVGITMFLTWLAMLICCIRFLVDLFILPNAISITDFSNSIAILCGVQGGILGIWLGRTWIKRNQDVKELPTDPGESANECGS